MVTMILRGHHHVATVTDLKVWNATHPADAPLYIRKMAFELILILELLCKKYTSLAGKLEDVWKQQIMTLLCWWKVYTSHCCERQRIWHKRCCPACMDSLCRPVYTRKIVEWTNPNANYVNFSVRCPVVEWKWAGCIKNIHAIAERIMGHKWEDKRELDPSPRGS